MHNMKDCTYPTVGLCHIIEFKTFMSDVSKMVKIKFYETGARGDN